MILINFINESYEEIRQVELSLFQKRSLFAKHIVDDDMDNNFQRDVLIDLFFHGVMHCIEKEFNFQVVQMLLSMIEDELLAMVHQTFDSNLPPTERISILHSKMITNVRLIIMLNHQV
jgi:hypothetical protein